MPSRSIVRDLVPPFEWFYKHESRLMIHSTDRSLKNHWLCLTLVTIAVWTAAPQLHATDLLPTWSQPNMAGLALAIQPDGTWQILSAVTGDYSIESTQSLPAKHGDAFALKLNAQVGIDMNALT